MVQPSTYNPLLSLARSQDIISSGIKFPVQMAKAQQDLENAGLKNLLAGREMRLKERELNQELQAQENLRNLMSGMEGMSLQQQAEAMIRSGNPDLIGKGVSLLNAVKPKGGRGVKWSFDSTMGRVIGVDQDTGQLIDPAGMVMARQRPFSEDLLEQDSLQSFPEGSPTLIEDITSPGSVSGPVGAIKSGANYLAGVLGAKVSNVDERKDRINKAFKSFTNVTGQGGRLKQQFEDYRSIFDLEPDVLTNDVRLADKMMEVSTTLDEMKQDNQAIISDPNIPRTEKVEARKANVAIDRFNKRLGISSKVKNVNLNKVKILMEQTGEPFEKVVEFLNKKEGK